MCIYVCMYVCIYVLCARVYLWGKLSTLLIFYSTFLFPLNQRCWRIVGFNNRVEDLTLTSSKRWQKIQSSDPIQFIFNIVSLAWTFFYFSRIFFLSFFSCFLFFCFFFLSSTTHNPAQLCATRQAVDASTFLNARNSLSRSLTLWLSHSFTAHMMQAEPFKKKTRNRRQ